jgi:histidinol-phosphate aminotransferase
LPDPSFVMLASFARMNGLVPVMIPLTESYDVDVDATRVGGARIVYICSPNNPTGTVIDRAAIEHIARDTDGLVIVDEAYAEFAGDSAVALTSSHPNLLVVRTMSKAFGLAGLRVGYAIGAPSLIAEIEKSRGPYKVNALGAAAAIAALREGMAWVRTHVALAVENRERLTDSLRARQLAVVPSLANFVLVPLANAAAIASAMRAAGVAVRPFTRVRQVSPELRRSGGDALRISVGPWDQLQRALDALDEARRTCA